MEKLATIYFWACNKFPHLEYKHTQEIPYDDVFKIAEEIANKGLNVMIQTYTSPTGRLVRTLFIDDQRFTQR